MATDPKGPNYYKRGSIDVWDFIREQGLNFHLGNAIKYITRAGHKTNSTDDLKKAIHYLENELAHVSDHNPRFSYQFPDSGSDRISFRLPGGEFQNPSETNFTEKFDR